MVAFGVDTRQCSLDTAGALRVGVRVPEFRSNLKEISRQNASHGLWCLRTKSTTERVSDSRSKSVYLAKQSIEAFFSRNGVHVWFWTFTEPGRAAAEPLWTKDEAEQHLKPFRDLCSRRGAELLVVWEPQSRGSWHPHCLVNQFFDVNWLRPWMVARGWGQQMKALYCPACASRMSPFSPAWRERSQAVGGVIRYLTKYLTKSWVGPVGLKKKRFSGTAVTKVGVTRFKWLPEFHPGAYLYAMGKDLWRQLYGVEPSFHDVWGVIRLGVEDSGWAEIDPLWQFGFPSGP